MKNIWIRIFIILFLGVIFGILTALVRRCGVLGFETQIYTQMASYINPALTSFVIFITDIGSFTSVTVIIVLLLILPHTRTKYGLPVALIIAVTAGLNIFLKTAIARNRPDILRLVAETGYGFPSGHAMNNAALYTMIAFIVFRRTKNKKTRVAILLLSIVLTLSIGISRIYLGVHNVGDVIAGWIMGVMVALIADTLWQAISSCKLTISDKPFCSFIKKAGNWRKTSIGSSDSLIDKRQD